MGNFTDKQHCDLTNTTYLLSLTDQSIHIDYPRSEFHVNSCYSQNNIIWLEIVWIFSRKNNNPLIFSLRIDWYRDQCLCSQYESNCLNLIWICPFSNEWLHQCIWQANETFSRKLFISNHFLFHILFNDN